MKIINITNLLKKEFTKSIEGKNRLGFSTDTEGFKVENICELKAVILKKRNWNNRLKKMEDVKSYEYIPTGKIKIEWLNSTMGIGRKNIDRNEMANKIEKYLNGNGISTKRNGEEIIIENIEVEIPNKIREII